MSLPLVTIVGRPNVGKSSLLNMLAGRRISIVEPTAGVTRDRIQAVCEHNGVYFEIVDTGGYGIVDRDDLSDHVERQITYAVQQATLILFVVDGREGVVPLDQAVAQWLRGCKSPVLLVANKVDAFNVPTELGDFPRLGFGSPLPVSALHNRGGDEIKDWITRHLPDTGEVPPEPVMKLAIVGRRNAGKSTFINALAGQERVIVSEVPGTTRDAVDVRFERNGRPFLAIDTAGLRKRSKIADDIEYYGFHRAQLSIRRADVVLFLIDSTSKVGHVDKQLAEYIADQHKPCILVINKWDLAKDQATTEDYGDYLLKVMPWLDYAPVAFTTAKDAKNIQSVIDLATTLFKQSHTRVGTGELNSVVEGILSETPPRAKHGRGQIKVFYATQISVGPPTIVLFVNDPARASRNFERFLINRLREALPFAEVPMRLIFRGRQRSGGEYRAATGELAEHTDGK
ncbi:MAG: ribosome biogenesis GTPase Der [Phycisphaerae bacterium]|nr:ribosome biogenesis GTPase Der [Phycisphaerae bacterium]